jgi:phosphoribosylglycinamide formyltransferase 1
MASPLDLGCAGTTEHDQFFLLTEDTFHASYLRAAWQQEFRGWPGFAGIVIRADPEPAGIRTARREFALEYQGKHELPADGWRELARLYPDLGEADRAMVTSFGVPAHPVADAEKTACLGAALNSASTRDWLAARCAGPVKPWFFIFLDRLLAPWWLELTGSRVINAHSAVLPHARGSYAIEQIAASRDAERFRTSAGATVHYVDQGIDTGPIIWTERFRDPFGFESIWECKGRSFALGFTGLIQVASRIAGQSATGPAGVAPAASAHRADFKRADFTPAVRHAAQAGFLAMKEAARAAGPLPGWSRPSGRPGA